MSQGSNAWVGPPTQEPARKCRVTPILRDNWFEKKILEKVPNIHVGMSDKYYKNENPIDFQGY